MKSHRIVAVSGAILFGAMLLGATDAAAAPPPTYPTGIDRPVLDPGDPVPPEPDPGPDTATPATEVAVDEPCDDCPPPDGDTITEPAAPETPADAPEATPQPAPRPSPSAGPVGRPRSIPAGIPTPTRIDTGEGPRDAQAPNWLLIGAPALALLSLAAGGAYLWIRRTDRSAR